VAILAGQETGRSRFGVPDLHRFAVTDIRVLLFRQKRTRSPTALFHRVPHSKVVDKLPKLFFTDSESIPLRLQCGDALPQVYGQIP